MSSIEIEHAQNSIKGEDGSIRSGRDSRDRLNFVGFLLELINMSLVAKAILLAVIVGVIVEGTFMGL